MKYMTLHGMKREIKRIAGRKRNRSRVLALLLGFALCVESAPLTVVAAQPEAGAVVSEAGEPDGESKDGGQSSRDVNTPGQPENGENAGQNPDEYGEPGEGAGQQNPGGEKGDPQEPGEGGEPAEGEIRTPGESGEGETGEPAKGEEQGPAEGEGQGSVAGEEQEPAEGEEQEPEEGEEQEPGEGGEQEPAEGEGQKPGEEVSGDQDKEEEGPEQVSGNDVEEDSVSENDLPSVSDNDLASLSENSLDTEREALVQAAQAAFEELLAQKPLMALLYHAESYDAREEADQDSGAAATLEIGQTLYMRGVEITEDDVWYEVQYLRHGAEGTGYVQSYYLAYSDEDWLSWEEEYLQPILKLGEDAYESTAYGMRTYSLMTYAVDTSDISAFPGSYQADLRNLKNAHPNWTFVPMKTGLDFNASVSAEMGDKSLIQATSANLEKGWVGKPCPSESGWNYATQPAVAYHMDPRNFLTETYIFQFEQLTFNASYHTESAVQTFLNGTFMKGKLPDDSAGRTYAKAFFEIGKGRKLSPVHLASRVYQEQGQGTSGLISGTYPGYEGYYNFFNVGVNGSSTAEKIVKGLTYAKNKGWNTRYKSLEGGAATIGNNYILKGQDTLYLEKFNVNINSPYGVYEHQYMQNIQAPRSEASSTKKMYTNAGSLNNAFVFKIPVYNNMPDDTYYPVLKLDKTSLTLNRAAEGEEPAMRQLKFYVDGVEADPAEAKWTSSDTSVARVQNGLVTAVDKGEAVITASYKEVEVSCKVTVKVPLQGITLDKEAVTLRRPDTVVEDTKNLSAQEKAENISGTTLQVSFDPADTTSDKTIVWTSANNKIATVKADPEDSARAVVTAVGTGEVKITAKASKAGNKAASCTVRVIAPIYRLELSDPSAEEGAVKTELYKGQSVGLSAEYWPKDTTSDKTIIWTSSNEKTATVKNGRVTAQGAGTAVITARAAGYAASYDVAVKVCSVVFHKADGSVGQRLSLGYGECVADTESGTMPEEQQIAGKVFRGWYTKPEGQGSMFAADQPVYAEETHVYPHYQEIGAEKGFYVIPVGDQIYTGSAIKPKVRVFDSTVAPDGSLLAAGAGLSGQGEVLELVEGRDYTLSYKNNKNVNAEGGARPTITVKGKGNYTGTEYIYFDILPKALTDHDITAADITVAYSGKTIKSAPAVYRGGKKLAANRDYTRSYPQTGTGAYSRTGVYPIVITGKGGYTGTITVYETITADVLLGKVSVEKISKQTYTNEQMEREGGIRPASLTVTYKKQPLVEGEHYTLSYSNDQSVGKATVTLTAVEGSGYAGSRSVTYQIVGTSLAKAKVEGLENREYVAVHKEWDTEDARYEAAYQQMLQPTGAYSLTLDDRVLTESKDGVTGDYVVSYAGAAKKGAVKAGTATIIFKGINEYSGQIKKSYKIMPCDLSTDRVGSDFSLSCYTQDEPDVVTELRDLNAVAAPYVKGGSKPVILLTFQGTPLEPGRDYKISYKNNKALTTAETEESMLPAWTITGKGNFKGKLTGTFTITDGQFDKVTDSGRSKVTMTLKDVVYREKKGAYKTKAALKDVNGSALAAGRDYDKNLQYTYEADTEVLVFEEGELTEATRRAKEPVGESDIPQAQTAIRVTAKGIGAYAGTGEAPPEISAVYRIVSADFTRAKVKIAEKNYQDGRPVTLAAPDLTVTVNGAAEPLVLGRDYIIREETYTNHTKKGKAKVTLRGIGNYGGEKTVTYTIKAKKLLWWIGQ